jgi:hypothetical protein
LPQSAYKLSRMLRLGCTGDDVRELQSMLNGQPPTQLAPLAVDGIFGPLTRGRVVEYQRNNQLAPDAIVGPLTWGMLKSKIRLLPASIPLRHRIALANTASADSGIQAQANRTIISFLIPVQPGNSTTSNIGSFSIDATPAMPVLPPLAVQIDGISPDPTPSTSFDWSVNISFDEDSCTCGKAGVTFNDGFTATVLGGSFAFSWPWMRGGDLTIAARAQIGGELVEAIFLGTISGTDPPIASVRAELGDDTMRRIANVESGFHQFEPDVTTGKIVPKFNATFKAGKRDRGDGGAGICQITPPSAEEIWDWKSNVRKGKQIFAGNRAAASAFLRQHIENGQIPNNLGLNNADAILREAIKNFNGGHFWQWNDAANRWDASPNNNYVDLVLAASP